MGEILEAWRSVDRNKIAAILSIIPGLGHLYKHHYAAGFGILTGGNILVGFVAVLMMLGTFGLSLLLIPLFIAGVAASAYSLEDWHGHHHFLHPWREEDGTDADDLTENS